jgi:D-alanyl-D-alanine carboxypeptidase
MIRTGLLVGVALLIALSGKTQQDLELHAKVQERLDDWRSEQQIPGVSIAIATGDAVQTWTTGLADQEAGVPIQPQDMLFSGSVGKTYVSAIILRMIGTGELRLEDRMHTYFGGEDWYDCLPNSEDLTLQMLLNHTSGLGRYIFQPSFVEMIKKDVFRKISPQEGLRHLCGTEAVHEPGKGWSYSDSNYLILGLLIEKLSGKTYYEVLEEDLLIPLDLKATRPTTSEKLPGLITGYIAEEHNFFELPKKTVNKEGNYVMDPSFEYTGGGLYCTPADLARWINLLHSGQVLSDSMLQLLKQAVDFRTGQPAEAGYGLGTFVWATPHGKHFGHAGMFPGYLTQVEHNAEAGFTIALQINTDGGDMRSMHTLILELSDMLFRAGAGKDQRE